MTEKDAQLIADLVAARLADSQQIAYTPATAARVCDLPVSTIRAAIADGTLRAKRRGKQYIISREALTKWVR